MKEIKTGDIAQLKVPLLGNPKGAFGVCYEKYHLIDDGWSFIFENGNYDGFSEWEVKKFLKIVGHTCAVEDYRFSNVMQLTHDFSRFQTAIKVWKMINPL